MMTQVWYIDDNGFYLNESDMVEEVEEGMITIPMTFGYVNPKFVDGQWIEGATEEEIKEWTDSLPKVESYIAPKTNEELENEIKLLKEQNEALNSAISELTIIIANKNV